MVWLDMRRDRAIAKSKGEIALVPFVRQLSDRRDRNTFDFQYVIHLGFQVLLENVQKSLMIVNLFVN